MKRNQVSGRAYCPPQIQIICLQQEVGLLAASPQVQPGGGGGGTVHVNPAPEDNEDGDNEVAGAKPWSGWVWEEETIE